MMLSAAVSSAFGQTKPDYKLETYKVEGSSAVWLRKTESVDSILVFTEFKQRVEAEKMKTIGKIDRWFFSTLVLNF